MTGFVSIFLALIGGLTAANRREIALVVGLPYLVVMGLQSYSIGSGHGVRSARLAPSPSSRG